MVYSRWAVPPKLVNYEEWYNLPELSTTFKYQTRFYNFFQTNPFQSIGTTETSPLYLKPSGTTTIPRRLYIKNAEGGDSEDV